jgi:ribosome-associated heat shock protein Hsp15
LAGPSAKRDPAAAPALRLDKWLWQARFFKSRSLAASLVAEGHVRVNGTPVSRPGREITPGDVLTFAQGQRIRVIRVLALGLRRGPATEAQALYADLDARPATPGPPTDNLE